MSKMKYIRFEDSGIIIFSDYIAHQDMAAKFHGEKPISAGFFNVMDADDVQCYGESVGLGLKSDPKDVLVLQRYLRGY